MLAALHISLIVFVLALMKIPVCHCGESFFFVFFFRVCNVVFLKKGGRAEGKKIKKNNKNKDERE